MEAFCNFPTEVCLLEIPFFNQKLKVKNHRRCVAVNHFNQGILAWVLGRQLVLKHLSHCGKLLNIGKAISM